MTSYQSNLQSITIDQLQDQFLKTKVKWPASAHKGLFLIIHGMLQMHFFELVGLGEEENYIEDKSLPDTWSNTSDESWTFRYRYGQSSLTYIIKGLRLGPLLIINGYSPEILSNDSSKIYQLELKVVDWLDCTSQELELEESGSSSEPNDIYSHQTKNQEKLKVWKSIILKKELELLDKMLYSKIIDNFLSYIYSDQQHQQTYVNGIMNPELEYFCDSDLYAVGGGFGGGPRRDANLPVPAFTPPYPGFTPGGSLIGPSHPGFGPNINDPYIPYRGGPRKGGTGVPTFHPPPPGARFDPFGPPDNDHFPPPRFDNNMHS